MNCYSQDRLFLEIYHLSRHLESAAEKRDQAMKVQVSELG